MMSEQFSISAAFKEKGKIKNTDSLPNTITYARNPKEKKTNTVFFLLPETTGSF